MAANTTAPVVIDKFVQAVFNTTWAQQGNPFVLLADPPTTGDAALVWLGVVLLLLTAAAVIFGLADRNFPPLKAKQMPILAASFIGSVFWCISSNQSTLVVANEGGWENCLWWKIWGQMVFGVLLFTTCLLVRFYILYRLLIQKNRITATNKWAQPVSALVFFAPALLLGIIPSFFAKSVVLVKPAYYLNKATNELTPTGVCVINPFVSYAYVAVTAMHLFGLAFFAYSLRNIRKAFNERNESIIGFAFALVAFLANTIIVLSLSHQKAWGRILLQAIVLLFSVGYIWVVISRPLFNAIFDRAGSAARFKDELKSDSLRATGSSNSKSKNGKTDMGSVQDVTSLTAKSQSAIDVIIPITPLPPISKTRADKESTTHSTGDYAMESSVTTTTVTEGGSAQDHPLSVNSHS